MATRAADRLPELRLPPAVRAISEALRGLDPRSWRGDNATESFALVVHSLRSSLFIAESVPLFLLQGSAAVRPQAPPPEGSLEVTVARLRELLERDSALIGQGLAPLSVLAPRDPLGHGARLLRILADGRAISKRKRTRKAAAFGRAAQRWLDDLPNYYRRNFHYQTDGYLSERSADLYEHQVELLFRGGADAMRRMILPPLAAHVGTNGVRRRGEGLRFLELGSGTGSATQSVARAFPEAKITCLDLSYPYTKHARKSLEELDRVECVQGDAAALEFADARFDAVYSVFMFHELPLPVREVVLDEARRVLRPGGFFGLVDSLQTGDDGELDWALDVFPREFHEPYYANYAANPMEALLEAAGFEAISGGTGYLAKWLAARSPA